MHPLSASLSRLFSDGIGAPGSSGAGGGASAGGSAGRHRLAREGASGGSAAALGGGGLSLSRLFSSPTSDLATTLQASKRWAFREGRGGAQRR